MHIVYINDGHHFIRTQVSAASPDLYIYMEAIFALTCLSKKTENTELFSPETTEKGTNRSNSFRRVNLRGLRKPYFKFYRVFKNETLITEVVTDVFKPFQPTHREIKIACILHSRQHPAFFLPGDDAMFYGFTNLVKAMEHAKAGALKYISKLIDDGGEGYPLLLKYREDHYEDLNINLTDRNIKTIEWTLEEAEWGNKRRPSV